MMSEQYLLSSHVEGHPSNSLVTKPRPPRNIKRSMMSLKPNINCFLPYPTIDKEHLKICNGEIHTKTVEDTIQNFKPNKVLNEAPPPIAKEEKELPRKTRARLAQLRSVVALRMGVQMKEETFPLEGQNSHRVKFETVQCNDKPFGVWYFGCGRFTNMGDLTLWAYREGPDTTLALSSDERQIDVYHSDCFNGTWRPK
ncbi:hypothetical protein M8J75_016232 [Diaphorina citri]|nr:hypothetical protein M8J75_016232 [Diaphorina citri]